ncbi:MAG TPA: winged helix-turn-helix transcriptional regulator [Epulopiscium sp.]|nr:winged helix-turn-helix transcriptional regulator [Candidatus Epulonipiscium sp.]
MDECQKNSPYHIFHQVIGLHHYRTHQLLDNQGAYPGQPPLLFALHKQDGQSQKELSEKLGIQPATITMMVKRMVKAGLIEKKQDQEDQRVSRIYLTKEGKDTRERVAIIAKKIEEECFSSLTDEDKEVFGKLLIKMRENLLAVCGDKCPLTYLKKDVKHE